MLTPMLVTCFNTSPLTRKLYCFLSSANEVWVGHRNAGRPSVRPTCEREILRTIPPFNFKFKIRYQTTENTDIIDFWPCAKTKMAAIELFMYAIDTPCERVVFRTA